MPRLSTHIHPAAAQSAAETVLAIIPKLNALGPSAHDDRSAMIAHQNPFAWEEKAFALTLPMEASPPLGHSHSPPEGVVSMGHGSSGLIRRSS
jgi:hypothetical protein